MLRTQLGSIRLFHLNMDLHYTWATFQLPDGNFGACVADVVERVRWTRIDAFNSQAVQDLHKIQLTLWDDIGLRSVPAHSVWFSARVSERGEFLRVGLDSPAQRTMFKLKCVGSAWPCN